MALSPYDHSCWCDIIYKHIYLHVHCSEESITGCPNLHGRALFPPCNRHAWWGHQTKSPTSLIEKSSFMTQSINIVCYIVQVVDLKTVNQWTCKRNWHNFLHIAVHWLKMHCNACGHKMTQRFSVTYSAKHWCILRTLVKSAWQKNILLISQLKHMLWVLKRSVSMRRFFWAPKTYAKNYG